MLLDQPSAPPQATGGSPPVGGAARAVLTAAAPCFVVMLAAATFLGEAGRIVHWRFLASAAGSRGALLLVVAGVVVGAVVATRARAARPVRESRGLWLASAPGLLLFAYAVVGQLLPLGQRAQWFLGGDHVRHLVFTAEETQTGYLDYSVNSYPRAWHTLVAMVWSASGAQQDAQGLISLVGLLSLGSWCVYALFTLATGQLAHALALRCGLPATTAARAGLAAGAITLWPSFLSQYQVLGFENSIVAALLVAVCAREVLLRPGSLQALVVCGACVAVMANAWQLLLPAPLLAFAVAASAVLRREGSPARVVAVVVTALVTALIAWPGLLAVTSTIGLGHAKDAGVVAPLPVVLLPAALLATIWVAVRFRGRRGVLLLAAMVLVTAASAVALAVKVGIPVTLYYPSKLLWSAGALGLVPLGVALSVAGDAAWRLGGRGQVAVRAAALGVVGVLLTLCAVNPALSVVSWGVVNGPRVMAAITAPGAGDTTVVWVPGSVADSTIARILTDFYRAGHTKDFVPQQPLGVTEECALLRQQDHPTVLTSAPADVVRARYACVADLGVVPVGTR